MHLPSRLSTSTLGDLLGALYRDKTTGLLDLCELWTPTGSTVPGRQHRILLHMGLVTGVETAFPALRLGELLERRGIILSTGVARLAAVTASRAGRLTGEQLVSSGLISRDELEHTLRTQLRTRLDALFNIDEASICFHTARPLCDSLRSIGPLDPTEVLHGRARARDRRRPASPSATPRPPFASSAAPRTAGSTPPPPHTAPSPASATPRPPQATAYATGATPRPPQAAAYATGATPRPPQAAAYATGTTPRPPQAAAYTTGTASRPSYASPHTTGATPRPPSAAPSSTGYASTGYASTGHASAGAGYASRSTSSHAPSSRNPYAQSASSPRPSSQSTSGQGTSGQGTSSSRPSSHGASSRSGAGASSAPPPGSARASRHDERKRNALHLLGLAEGATETDVRRAFRRMAARLHPDRATTGDATARFAELSAAYHVLVA
ncbi:DnaJ domain-containing protein [Chondromyces crocatus]|uniref:J domain-containing protein n=1 Tax=Chondromyces crocatus TaxID=52 RepID=A0A0K1ELW9_CHOCO|nr:DnaJ domain-containing protein [Chondromyces crocatus]AKT41657.1 uncharacterized protein CMC5_058630 [Chondromyces crocatus]